MSASKRKVPNDERFILGSMDDMVTEVEDWIDDFRSSTAGEGDKSANRMSRLLGKVRGHIAALDQYASEREFPVAAAMRSYTCPKCRANVSPICCGNDPR